MPVLILILCLFTTLGTATTTSTSVKDPNAVVTNAIQRLDTLIQATTQSLEEQKKIRESIVEYHHLQELYMFNTKDNDLLFRMAKAAHRVLELIKENHLLESFDPDFIDEITVFAQAAKKRGIPK